MLLWTEYVLPFPLMERFTVQLCLCPCLPLSLQGPGLHQLLLLPARQGFFSDAHIHKCLLHLSGHKNMFSINSRPKGWAWREIKGAVSSPLPCLFLSTFLRNNGYLPRCLVTAAISFSSPSPCGSCKFSVLVCSSCMRWGEREGTTFWFRNERDSPLLKLLLLCFSALGWFSIALSHVCPSILQVLHPGGLLRSQLVTCWQPHTYSGLQNQQYSSTVWVSVGSCLDANKSRQLLFLLRARRAPVRLTERPQVAWLFLPTSQVNKNKLHMAPLQVINTALILPGFMLF